MAIMTDEYLRRIADVLEAWAGGHFNYYPPRDRSNDPVMEALVWLKSNPRPNDPWQERVETVLAEWIAEHRLTAQGVPQAQESTSDVRTTAPGKRARFYVLGNEIWERDQGGDDSRIAWAEGPVAASVVRESLERAHAEDFK